MIKWTNGQEEMGSELGKESHKKEETEEWKRQ